MGEIERFDATCFSKIDADVMRVLASPEKAKEDVGRVAKSLCKALTSSVIGNVAVVLGDDENANIFRGRLKQFLQLQLLNPQRVPGQPQFKPLEVSDSTIEICLNLFLEQVERYLKLGENTFKLSKQHFIWMVLLDAEDPLTVAEISGKTGYSVKSITQNFIDDTNKIQLSQLCKKIQGSVAEDSLWIFASEQVSSRAPGP